MKTALLFILLFVSLKGVGQPQGINYQGVARDSLGHILSNQNISLRLSILDSSSDSNSVYVETHNVLTNLGGLFNVIIGTGDSLSGLFHSINWGSSNKWLKIELDPTGGNSFLFLGVTQFMSVPYSLYSLHSKETNGENWQYFTKYVWNNDSLFASLDNLPIHDFWMLNFNFTSENNLSIWITLNNIRLPYVYQILEQIANPNITPSLFNFDMFALNRSYSPNNFRKGFGSLIVTGKSYQGQKDLINNNFRMSGLNDLFIKYGTMYGDPNDLTSIQIMPTVNITGQVELYWKDNR